MARSKNKKDSVFMNFEKFMQSLNRERSPKSKGKQEYKQGWNPYFLGLIEK